MVIKNLFLTLLAISLVFGAQNYDLLVSEPAAFENGMAILAERDSDPALANESVAVMQVESAASAAPILIPAQNIANDQRSNSVSGSKLAISTDVAAQKTATLPQTVISADGSQEFEVSEWLDVPRSVIDRVMSIPLPVSANGAFSFAVNTATPKPSAAGREVYYSEIGSRPVVTEMFTYLPVDLTRTIITARVPQRPLTRSFSLVETTSSRVSSAIVGRPLLPLLPEAVAGRSSLRPFLLAETASSKVSSSILARPLTPLLPRALTQTFLPAETASLRISSAITARPLMPLLPRTLTQTFLPAETTSLRTSSAITARPLMRLLPEAIAAKPSIRAIPYVETTSLRVTSSVAARPLMSLLPVPVTKAPVEKPRIRIFDLTETTSSPVATAIAGRALLPLLPEAVTAKGSLRSFPLTETRSSAVSTSVAGRALLPLLPEAVAARSSARVFPNVEIASFRVSTEILRRPLLKTLPEIVAAKPSARSFSLAETTSSPVSTPILGRSLMPLIPSARAISLAETTSSQVSSGVTGRPLLSLLETSVFSKQVALVARSETKPAAGSINAALTAVNISPPRNENPVVINGQKTFSQSMLGPLGFIPTLSQMASSDAPETTTSGPSIEASVAKENTTTANAAKVSAHPLPVMITAQSGFSLDMLKPLSSRPVFPPNPDAAASSVSVNTSPAAQTADGYCDPNFVGPPIRFSQTVELKLEDLINQLNSRFGVNFIIGPGISELPLNVKAGSIPWTTLLRSQLFVSGVRARCIDANTIELVLNEKVAGLEKAKLDAEKLETKYIKLKYLQPSSSGNKNIAGQSTGGGGGGGTGLCQLAASSGGQGNSALGGSGGGGGDALPQRCKFERLMSEIRQILGLNDKSDISERGLVRSDVISVDQSSTSLKPGEVIPKRAYVGQVPGRNMLIVNATTAQLGEIGELIKRADVPPFQVVIKGLVYTANENKLKDIGVTASAIIGTGNLNSLGGIASQPGVSNTPQPSGTPAPGGTPTIPIGPGNLVPGGVRSLGLGFDKPTGSGDGIFGFSTIIGTAQFSAQIRALQQNGAISLKSRPFATVLDGDTTDLTVGRQIPVIIQPAINVGGAEGTLRILQAANLLSVTPHVIDDENGNPTAVNLELQLESNEPDPTIVSQGVPTVLVRSIQSNFILNLEQTAILGGFTIDSDSKTVTKTPGLGDIPIIGELFKRRVSTTQISRLYFAISVTVIPYGGQIEPVKVPGATTDPPSITPEMKKRADKAEPKQVVDPK